MQATSLQPTPALLPAGVGLDDAVIWIAEDRRLVGHGGWTIEITGPERLRRASAIWRATVSSTDDAVCFVSSVFDDRSPSATVLRIPAVLDKTTSDAHVTVTQAIDVNRLDAAVAAHGPAVVVDRRSSGELQSSISADRYADAVRTALDEISRGTVSKVVLCRDQLVEVDGATSVAALQTLAERYSSCWTFAVGGLIGSSPEMLASLESGVVTSRVLAGSLPRRPGVDEDVQKRRLLTETAFAAEHEYAARSVIDGLATRADLDDESPRPFVLELPNIFHLATDVRGHARRPEDTVLDLVDAIHPTAAVAGVPRSAALDLIRSVESRDRGRYAGPVGWVDASGDGEIALAIRCGQLEEDGVRLFAGGGIVSGADPEAEVVETVSKMQPLREALMAHLN